MASSGARATAALGSGEADGDNDVGMGTQANGTPKKVSRDRKDLKHSARKSPYKVFKREESHVQSASDNNAEGNHQSAIDSDELERMVFGEPDEEEEDDGPQEYMDAVADNNLD